jgi:hypothetical protein
VLVAAALAGGGVSAGALLTADTLRHPARALVNMQIIDNASEHCEHVNKVILLQCCGQLRVCISREFIAILHHGKKLSAARVRR